MCYHRSVVAVKIYPLCLSKSFHPLLLLFLFDWLMKWWQITKLVSINYYGFYSLLHHTSGQMHVNVIISEPAIKTINKYNVNIAMYWFKSQTTYKPWWFYVRTYVCVLELLFAYIVSFKIVIKHMWCYECRLFSPGTDSSQMHFTFKQIDLHILRLITAASSCRHYC